MKELRVHCDKQRQITSSGTTERGVKYFKWQSVIVPICTVWDPWVRTATGLLLPPHAHKL